MPDRIFLSTSEIGASWIQVTSIGPGAKDYGYLAGFTIFMDEPSTSDIDIPIDVYIDEFPAMEAADATFRDFYNRYHER